MDNVDLFFFQDFSISLAQNQSHKEKITSIISLSEKYFLFSTSFGRIIQYNSQTLSSLEIMKKNCEISMMDMNLLKDVLIFTTERNEIVMFSMISKETIYSMQQKTSLCFCAIKPEFKSGSSPDFVFVDTNNDIFHVSKLFFFMTTQKIASIDSKIVAFKWIDSYFVIATSDKMVLISTKDNSIHYSVKYNAPYKYCIPCIGKISNNIIGIVTDSFIYAFHTDEIRQYFFMNNDCILFMLISSDKCVKLLIDDKNTINIMLEQYNSISIKSTPVLYDPNEKFYSLEQLSLNSYIFANSQCVIFIKLLNYEEQLNQLVSTLDDDQLMSVFLNWKPFLTQIEKVSMICLLSYHFLCHNAYSFASSICERNLDDRIEDWDDVITLYHNNLSLKYISSVIPVNVIEKSSIIVEILIELLNNDTQRFCYVFERIGENSFPPNELIGLVQAKALYEKVFNIPLMHLYHRLGNHEKALDSGLEAIYIYLLEDIRKYEAWEYALSRFDQLYLSYSRLFLEFLIKTLQNLPPTKVLPNLRKWESAMLDYMDYLTSISYPIPDTYKTDLALLYIKNHHPMTMNFLTNERFFDFPVVQKEAISQKLYKEAAFLSRKMGNPIEGMKIHLNYIRIPHESVDYAMRAENEKVWRLLIESSYQDHELLMYILYNLPSLHIDSVDFVKNIPESMADKIDLKNSSSRTIKEFQMRLAAVKLTREMISNTAFETCQKQLKLVKRGVISYIKDE